MDFENKEKELNRQKDKEEQINKMLPIINKKENNLEIILMEKDKEIINLSDKNAKLNLDLENLSNELKSKNMELSTLNSDIVSLNNEKKLFEEEIQKYQSQIAKLNNLIKEKDKIIEESNLSKDLNNKKYMSLLEEQKNETNNFAEKNLKLQNEINELTTKLIRKDRDINNLENIICKNREKDNKILILTKDIKERENTIKDIQKKLIIANNDLKTSKNFNEERMKQLYNYNTKNKSNDIISFVINKIQNLILFVDSNNNFDKQNMNIEKNIIEIKEDFVLYDLLEQNISILKNKIFNKYKNIIKQNKENENKYHLLENENKGLILSLQQIKSSNNEKMELLSQKINQLQKNMQSKDEEIRKSNVKISELNNYSSRSISQNNFNNFYSIIISKLSEEYLKELNLGENKSEQNMETKMKNILDIIDFLNEKLNNLNKFVKEYDIYKVKVNNIINQKFHNSNEQIDEINELKNNIQELNFLLNQSNNYLSKTRNENSLLKKKILNLEKSINMISRNNLITNNNESKYLLTYNNDNKRNNNILLED